MSEPKKTFYVTTPIYYVNDIPHIGHAYSTVGADALARFKRMDGYEVFFLTGTDEHGQKIAKTAKEKGLEPKQLADQVVERFKEVWKRLGITHDRFIRTTDEDHRKAAQTFFKKVQEAGYIHKSHYEGWYCLPDEKFLLDSEVKDGKCPDCGRPVERIKEENYFFAMSKFQGQLEKYLNEHPDFIQPDSRKNELVNNFIKPGLTDVSITRSTVKWGIPAPVSEETVIYVWFDALINYISALGWPDGEKYKKFWPADVHIIGKDILRFHATIWPTMLMAAGLELPKKIFGTGFINMGGDKMSKSLGNVVNPMDLIDMYGADALRYYLLREIQFGIDGNFSINSFELRFNGDLANDLGNLVHRTLTMVEKYFNGIVPPPSLGDGSNELFKNIMGQTRLHLIVSEMDKFHFDLVLEDFWKLIKYSNKYIEVNAPWKLAKNENDKQLLKSVVYNLVESLRITAIRLAPFMPFTAQKIWEQLGYDDKVEMHKFIEIDEWGGFKPGQIVKRGYPLFPRIEKKEITELTEDDQVEKGKEVFREKVYLFLKDNKIKLQKYGWFTSGEEFKKLSSDGKYGFFFKGPSGRREIIEFLGDELIQINNSQQFTDEIDNRMVQAINRSLADKQN